MEPLHPRWAYLLPLILNRNAKCLQAVLTCIDVGSISPRNVRSEDVPDVVFARHHEQVTSFKNIFSDRGPKTLEKSLRSRYTYLDGRFVHGGSPLCAFLYGAVSELALGHSSFSMSTAFAGNTQSWKHMDVPSAQCIIRHFSKMSSAETQYIVLVFIISSQGIVFLSKICE